MEFCDSLTYSEHNIFGHFGGLWGVRSCSDQHRYCVKRCSYHINFSKITVSTQLVATKSGRFSLFLHGYVKFAHFTRGA